MKDSLDMLLTEPVYVAHDSLNILNPDVICHHGILGMKWGIRRYQNKDGSLTAAGKKRYYVRPDDDGYAGNLLTKKGKKEFKNKDGSWKDTPAAQKAKERYDANIKKALEKDAEKLGITNEVATILNKDYTVETTKGYYGDYTTYTKKSPKDKKKAYEIKIDAEDLNKSYNFKQHDEFEKHSEKILKECEEAAYEDVKDWGEGHEKETFIKNLETPYIYARPDSQTITIEYFSPDVMHYPTIEYDIKNKKVLNTSLQG